MQMIFKKSLKDIFSTDVLLFVLKVGTFSALTTSLFLWFFWEGMSSFIVSYLSWIPWEWLQSTGAKAMTIGLAYIFFTIMIGIFTSLYSESLLIKLAKKHYPSIPVVATPNISKSLWISLKAIAVFLLLLMLLFPLLFIPILGQVIMLFLWSILLRKPTIYDVGSLFMADKTVLKQRGNKTRLLAMIASLFNYIPLLNLFAPVFAQILFLHHILGDFEEG